MDILLKALNDNNFDDKIDKAISLYKAKNPSFDRSKNKASSIHIHELYENRFLKVFDDVINDLKIGLNKFLGLKIKKSDDDFVIDGKIIYNPQTGKPLKKKEWHEIKSAIDRYMSGKLGNLDESYTVKQYSLGSVLQRMEASGIDIKNISEKDIADKIFTKRRDYEREYNFEGDELNSLDNAISNLGNHISAISDKTRTGIVATLVDGISNNRTNREVSREMLDRFGHFNRDWERVTAYESQYSFNNGYLTTEMKYNEPDEIIYMQAFAMPNACDFCKTNHNEKIYILAKDRAEGSRLLSNSEIASDYILIGQTNMGNAKADWNPGVIPAHPFCRCRLVRWYSTNI